MKKISLLFVMLLAFTVSTTAQSLPKPLNPTVQDWIDRTPTIWPDNTYKTSSEVMLECGMNFMGVPVADDYPGRSAEFEAMDEGVTLEYTTLDKDKVSYSIYTDNDKIFVLTPAMYPDIFDEVYPEMEEATQIPFGYEGGDIEYWFVHFPHLTNNVDILKENGIDVEPFFTWRIGVQTHYTDNGQTSSSDIVYMEVFPQLQEAKNVTSTSFLADWSCDAENTYLIDGFESDDEECGYSLYIIDMVTQETTVIRKVTPTNSYVDLDWGSEHPLPGAYYTVEGLTPGHTYQFYVVAKGSHVFQSVVREVTLPETVYMLGGDDQNWDCTKGTEFEYNAEHNNYTATITFPAEFNYFGFTTRLAENNDDGGWAYIEPFRFGAVADENTDFWYSDELNGQPIDMTWDAYHAVRIASGEYKLTVDLTDMTLTIERVVPDHGYDVGDVNHDHAVNIADVTKLIDYLLDDSTTICLICADVKSDGAINIADVTSLIDILLGN